MVTFVHVRRREGTVIKILLAREAFGVIASRESPQLRYRNQHARADSPGTKLPIRDEIIDGSTAYR
jgi:hypothetical protein